MQLERRFQISIMLFAVLIAMVWIGMKPTLVEVAGRGVDIRWLPTLILGMFAFKAYIHRQAEKIRAEDEGSRRE